MTLTILTVLWGWLKKIPWWLYVAIGLVVYHFGALHVAASRATEECNAAWQKKIAAAQSASEEAAKRIEQAHAAALADLDTKYQQELKDANDQKDRDVAAARAGRIVLRYIPAPAKLPDPPASPGGGDDPKGAELPPEVTASLYALADDADQVAKQLASCQAVVEADRK